MLDEAQIRQNIAERLTALPEELRPIGVAAQPYLRHRCEMRSKEDHTEIAHSPWIGARGFAFRIYPATEARLIAKYEKLHGIAIPPNWKSVLVGANGLEALGLTLFGIPASMLNDPPLLNRAAFQCLDIGLANAHWKYEYKVSRKYFHVGVRDYSDTELVGYFLTDKDTLVGIRKNGRRIGEWAEVDEFLSKN
jgi:hypothetical protein